MATFFTRLLAGQTAETGQRMAATAARASRQPGWRRGLTALLSLGGLLLGGAPALAQAPTWQTVIAPTQASPNTSFARVNATDASGNVYLTGQFSGSATFGSTVLTSSGNNDFFLAKWSPSSNTWLWAVKGGGTGGDYGAGIAVSGTNVYVTGTYFNNASNGSGVSFGSTNLLGATGTATNDVFVARYSDTGTLQWIRGGGGSDVDVGYGLAVSGTNVYITGFVTNNSTNTRAVQFGGTALPGATTSITADVFIAKYTDTGVYQWARCNGGNNTDIGWDIAASGTSVYVTGSFFNNSGNGNNVAFGGSALAGLSSTASNEAFLVKYNDLGTMQWARAGGGTGDDVANGVVVNGTDIYLTGWITNTVANANNVNFGGALNGASTTSSNDVLVARYNDAGALQWARCIGGGLYEDRGNDITISGSNLYISGHYQNNAANGGSVLFGGSAIAGFGSGYSFDMFVASVNTAGTLRWIRSGGGSSDDDAYGITADGANIHTSGSVWPTMTLGSTVISPANGGTRAFGARLVEPLPTISSFTPTSGPAGTVVTITGTNFTGASAVSFNGTAATTFTVNSATQITATVAAGSSTGPISVTTGAGTATSGTNFTFISNQAPTALNLSSNSVAENTGANAVVGTLSSTDPDAGNAFTYSLVSGTGSTDNALVNISGNSLRITASPDFETKSSYAVRVRTTDQGGLFFEQTFTISITDVNETPTDLNLSSSSIAENTGSNAVVGTLSSTDPDAGNTFTYALVSGAGSTDNGLVNISGNSLRITASPDFETKSSYAIRVRTTDQGGLFFEQTFTISITDANEAPTDLNLSSSSIAENTGSNAVVGTLSSTDPDAGNTFTYSLVSGAGSTDNGLVNISGNSLRITASPDFETKNSYAVRVRTTDQGGLFFEQTFTISITDANEAPTALSLSNNTLAENVGANVVVGLFSTTDIDAGDAFTYSLVSGAGSTHNAAFSISGNQLRIVSSPDFETQNSYAIRVRTTDQGGLFFEQTFTISITDEAEDLIVSGTATIPAGLYHDLIVTGSGNATLGADLTLTGDAVVQTGGVLNTSCRTLAGPGAFTLQPGATLRICDPAGISAAANTGAIRLSGGRTFAPNAHYDYTGIASQQTGDGLPATVQQLTVSNPTSVVLTQDLAIARLLTLAGSGNLVLGGQNLTLLSNGTGTAMVVNAGSGVVSGPATVQRDINGALNPSFGYRHFAAPVTNATVASLTTAGFTPVVNPAFNTAPNPLLVTPYPNVFGFNENLVPSSSDFTRAYYSPAALTTALTAGRGWSVYLPATATPAFVGTLGNGNVPAALTRTGNYSGSTQKSGWNMLGNPYPSPLDWDLITNANRPAAMSASISVFQSTGTGQAGQYLTRANGIGSLTDGLVPMGQGFFARLLTGSAATFTFTNSLRPTSYATATLYRPADADPRPVLTLALRASGSPLASQTYVYFQAGATENLDADFDGQQPSRNIGMPTLMTLTPQADELAINGLPAALLPAGTTVPLRVALPAAGNYELVPEALANLTGHLVELVDVTTGTRYDLATTPLVRFAVSHEGDLDGRFLLAFNARPVVTGLAAATNALPLTVWPNPATATNVRLTGLTAAQTAVLLDATGRVVRRAEAGATTLDVRALLAGVYLVRASDGRTTRLVLE